MGLLSHGCYSMCPAFITVPSPPSPLQLARLHHTPPPSPPSLQLAKDPLPSPPLAPSSPAVGQASAC